ncbi:beta-galactosidase [Halorhabdus amylolytica]|uniref:beta-galactosidase n=1 Tax=Halorhabdus amylolytica TaxID=2559573 RepID=UPI001B7D8754|nr:beta-galactosidase [Halorhabdus amylolytica]
MPPEHYEDVKALNKTWGTAFWSQQYRSLSDVDLPEPTPSGHLPSLLLEYYRFASDSAVTYNERQAARLREANDEWFLTHNVIGGFETLDVHVLGDTVDFPAWDSYPTRFVQTRSDESPTRDELWAGDPDELALYHAICRGAAEGAFWRMEQQLSDINWPPASPQPVEGTMRLWTLQANGHGTEAVVYFSWRTCSQGQEQYHSGLLGHVGRIDRGYRDADAAAGNLDALAAPAQPDADVAVLLDYESLWALSE